METVTDSAASFVQSQVQQTLENPMVFKTDTLEELSKLAAIVGLAVIEILEEQYRLLLQGFEIIVKRPITELENP